MPLSDWREGEDHLDAQAGVPAIYDLDYLRSNVEGGEGFDWYYRHRRRRAGGADPHPDHRRRPWRALGLAVQGYPQLVACNPHHERIGGVRQAAPTGWVPQSKPIWFTELGCAAIDKGTNQPNKFLDPKSSESALPYYSNGMRDDLIQIQYLRAILGYWGEARKQPGLRSNTAPMLDMSNAYVWAWDARPLPGLPQPQQGSSGTDGENYLRGHWLNGRAGQRTLASVVERSGVPRAGLQDVRCLKQLYGRGAWLCVTRVWATRARCCSP